MISDKSLASKVSELILEANRILNDAVLLVDENGSAEELKEFKLAIGQVSGELLLSVVNPLYRKHPELKPPELFVPGCD